jgi:hypothetical protein
LPGLPIATKGVSIQGHIEVAVGIHVVKEKGKDSPRIAHIGFCHRSTSVLARKDPEEFPTIPPRKISHDSTQKNFPWFHPEKFPMIPPKHISHNSTQTRLILIVVLPFQQPSSHRMSQQKSIQNDVTELRAWCEMLSKELLHETDDELRNSYQNLLNQ